MNEIELDPYVWFCNREMAYKPKHFVTAKTPVTNESLLWIVHNLRGRFYLSEENNSSFITTFSTFSIIKLPSFEDPHESILYELKWS